MDRSIWTMQECADKCLNDTHCKSFNYGEGELHFYSDTCELYSDSASSGDGNEGWSCYSKYCFKVDDDTAYHVHAENNSYGLQERSILFLPIAFIIFLLDFWTQRHYVPFKFEGPFVCNISWLNCSRQLTMLKSSPTNCGTTGSTSNACSWFQVSSSGISSTSWTSTRSAPVKWKNPKKPSVFWENFPQVKINARSENYQKSDEKWSRSESLYLGKFYKDIWYDTSKIVTTYILILKCKI